MPAGYETEEEARRRREQEMRESGAGGNSRGYRGDYEPGDNPYGANYTGYDYLPQNNDPNLSGTDQALEGVPLLGWLTGADARASAARSQSAAQDQRDLMLNLAQSAPTAEELTPEYYQEGTTDTYGDLLGGPSQLEGYSSGDQRAALGQIGAAQSALMNIANHGGLTSADRQALTAQRLREGQALRGANQAAIQQMGARGMGGGGAELAARLSGSQAYANANAMNDASIMQGAQARAMQALAGAGSLGSAYGSVAGQMNAQELARRQAIDAYNRANTDWRRGRESRNTAWANRQQDSRVNARQQAYQNQERAVVGAAGYNPYGAGAADRQRQDQANRDLGAGIGSLISEIL